LALTDKTDSGGRTLSLKHLEALTDSVASYGGDKVLITSKPVWRQISTLSPEAGVDLYEVIEGRHFFEGVEILLVHKCSEGQEGQDDARCRAQHCITDVQEASRLAAGRGWLS
jgi:hypothetical protein